MSAIPSLHFLQECRQKSCILALCVLLSSGLGASICLIAGEPYLLLMRMAVSCRVSIVGLVVCFAPYLVFVLFHSKPWLVCFLCGLRILLASTAILAIYISFGSAGWLVSLLMHFPDICLIPTMIWIYIRSNRVGIRQYCLALTVAYIVVVGMIYYCLISPFLANLIGKLETMGRYAIHAGLDRCL